MATKPTQSIFPIENGKLLTPLDCNNLQLINLDESNLSGGGGGGGSGNDTGTTTALLKGDGNHGFADALPGIDYATASSVIGLETETDHDADISVLTDLVATNTADILLKADDAATTAALALKLNVSTFESYQASNDSAIALKADEADLTALEDVVALKAADADLQAYILSNDAEVALKAYMTDVDAAIGLKADITALNDGLALKEPLLPTAPSDGWILSGNTDDSKAWVDPITLGTSNQTFTDGGSNTDTSWESNQANFVDPDDVGLSITGTNIPGGTTIASVTDENTIVLSQATTGTGTGLTFTIYNRLSVPVGGGTVTSVAVSSASVNDLLTIGVTNPTTSPIIGITKPTVLANTFYGSNVIGAPVFMSAATSRTALGGTAVGQALFQATSISATSWPRVNADNSVTMRSSANVLTDIGGESALTFAPFPPFSRSTNTITLAAAGSGVAGYLTAADWNTFNSKLAGTTAITVQAPLATTASGLLSSGITLSIPSATTGRDGYLTSTDWNTFNGKVGTGMTIVATAPLTIDGLASANLSSSPRTLAMPAAAGDLVGPPVVPLQSGYLTGADHNLFVQKPPNSRQISVSAPLTGGGDLSANRTIAIPSATAVRDGYLAKEDFAAFSSGSAHTQEITAAGGTVTVTASTPPITRVVFKTTLTSALTVNLPLPNLYTAASGYPFLEFVDVASPPAMTSFGITLTATGGSLLDGVVNGSVVLPRSLTYMRLNSDASSSPGRWTSTKYFVDSFRDATTSTKSATVDVSGLTASATRVIKVANAATSVTVIPFDPIGPTVATPNTPRQFLTGVGGSATVGVTGSTVNGAFMSSTVSPTDILPNQVTVADADLVITPSDGTVDTIRLSTTNNALLTAVRNYTFPNVDLYSPGESVRFYDASGCVNTTFYARVITGVGNTFNGQASINITEPFFNRIFVADPTGHNWTVSTFGGTSGSGLTLDPWHSVTPSGGIATINCVPNVVENHHVVNMTGAITLAMTGTIPAGVTGRIKFRDTTGGHIVTVPNSIGKTPSPGVGVFTTSSGTNVEDEYGWDWDTINYNFYPLGRNMLAAAAPAFNTIADDTTAAAGTAGNQPQNDSVARLYIATKLIANGGVGAGVSYLIGRIRLSLFRVGTPTYGLKVEVRADNGLGTSPTTTLVSTVSTAVPASGLGTTETNVDFDASGTLVNGTTYWIVLSGDGSTDATFTDGHTDTTTNVVGPPATSIFTSATATFVSTDAGKVVVAPALGIPTNTTISSVTNSTTVVLNKNVTATGTGSFTIQNRHFVDWVYHPPPGGTNQMWSSSNGITWTSVSGNRLAKYITYK